MDPLKIASASIKGHVTKLSDIVNEKLNTIPKKVGAIIGGSAVVGATAFVSLPFLILAGVGSLIVAGTIGVGISGAYLTYKTTKEAAEGLADSPNFQNTLEALSISKFIGKIFEKSVQNKLKNDFKSNLKKDKKTYDKEFKKAEKQAKENIKKAKEKSESKVTIETTETSFKWIPTDKVKNMLDSYVNNYYDGNLGEAETYLNEKELNEFIELKGTLDKQLKKYSPEEGLNEDSINKAFYAYVSKQERVDENKKAINPGKYNLSVGMEKLAKLNLYMKLIEARSKADRSINYLRNYSNTNISRDIEIGKKDIPLTPKQKENYNKYIKPIEKLFIKNGKGNWKNFDPKKLTANECKKIKEIQERLDASHTTDYAGYFSDDDYQGYFSEED